MNNPYTDKYCTRVSVNAALLQVRAGTRWRTFHIAAVFTGQMSLN